MPKKGGRPKGSRDSQKRKSGSGRRAGGAGGVAKASKSTGGGPNVPSGAAPARAPTAKRPSPLEPGGRDSRPAWAERLISAFPGSSAAKQKSTAQVQTGLAEHADLRPLVNALEKRPASYLFQSVPDGGAIDRANIRAVVLLRERQAGCDTPAASAAGGEGALLADGAVDAPSVGAQSVLAGTASGAALVACGTARTSRPFLPSR